MSLYLHLETSPAPSGDDTPRGRKQDDFHTCPFWFWAPPPGEENSFCSRKPVWCGMCGAGVRRPVSSHSVPSLVPWSYALGGREEMRVSKFLVPGVLRQASCGPVVQESLTAVQKIPSRIRCRYVMWSIFTGLCHYKGLFHHQTPLCVPDLKQRIEALTPNSYF